MIQAIQLSKNHYAGNVAVSGTGVASIGKQVSFSAKRKTEVQVANRLIQEIEKGKPLVLGLDFDGTLFPYNTPYRDLKTDNIQSIIRLAELLHERNGYPSLILITGRPMSKIREFFQGELAGKPIIVVGENGGHLYDCYNGMETSLIQDAEKTDLAHFNRLFKEKNTDASIQQLGESKFLIDLGRVTDEIRLKTKQLIEGVYNLFKGENPDTKLKFRDLFNIFTVSPDYFNKREGLKLISRHMREHYDKDWGQKDEFFGYMGDGRNDYAAFNYIRENSPERSLTLFLGPNSDELPAQYYMMPEGITVNDQFKPAGATSAEGSIYKYEHSRQQTKQVWDILYRLRHALEKMDK
jgi:hydroxymethylpyrimidine pyrophosphatase-like HAD family hydrolase